MFCVTRKLCFFFSHLTSSWFLDVARIIEQNSIAKVIDACTKVSGEELMGHRLWPYELCEPAIRFRECPEELVK